MWALPRKGFIIRFWFSSTILDLWALLNPVSKILVDFWSSGLVRWFTPAWNLSFLHDTQGSHAIVNQLTSPALQKYNHNYNKIICYIQQYGIDWRTKHWIFTESALRLIRWICHNVCLFVCLAYVCPFLWRPQPGGLETSNRRAKIAKLRSPLGLKRFDNLLGFEISLDFCILSWWTSLECIVGKLAGEGSWHWWQGTHVIY